MKKGRFSKSEISYIKLNYETHPITSLAETLDRDPDSVKSFSQTSDRESFVV